MAEFLGTPQNTLITVSIKRNDANNKTEVVDVTLGNVQSFAYQVRRAKAPIYVIGSAEPITIGKGARSVAGSMQGVVLADSFFHKLMAYFWAQGEEYLKSANGIYRLQGKNEYDISNFIEKFVKPYVQAITGKEQTVSEEDFEIAKDLIFYGNNVPLSETLKIPPLYLDEIPPMDIKLITPLEFNNGEIKYEEVTLYGVEFLNNDLAIQAGNEAIFEAVNFLQRSVTKVIKVKKEE